MCCVQEFTRVPNCMQTDSIINFFSTLAVWDADDKGGGRLAKSENPILFGAIHCGSDHHVACIDCLRPTTHNMKVIEYCLCYSSSDPVC